MVRLSDFRPNQPIVPNDESARQNRFREYLGYYEGIWPLKTEGGRRINWFRRLAHAYPELLFSDRATIVIEGNEALTELIPVNAIFSAFYHASIDLIRHGTGVVYLPAASQGSISSVSPTQWYPVYDEFFDNHIGDVVVRIIGNHTKEKDRRAVVDFYIAGEQPRRTVFRVSGSNFGALVTEENYDLPADVTYIESITAGENIDGYGESFYPDIVDAVKEMGSELTILSRNISQNSDPSLYGPDGAVSVNAAGEYVVEDGAKYIPVEPGQSPPGFLTWDSEVQAITGSYKLNEELVYVFSGLPRGLYDPSVVSGNTTGSALRRALIPLIARLSLIGRNNEAAIVSILRNYFALTGVTANYSDSDVNVEFGYEFILGDVNEAENPAETQPTIPTE